MLEKNRKYSKIYAKFNSTLPIKFVKANHVFEKVQIDLMSMTEVESDGKKFKYSLTALKISLAFCL